MVEYLVTCSKKAIWQNKARSNNLFTFRFSDTLATKCQKGDLQAIQLVYDYLLTCSQYTKEFYDLIRFVLLQTTGLLFNLKA